MRKVHAPKVAKLALESTSLKDMIMFGKSVMYLLLFFLGNRTKTHKIQKPFNYVCPVFVVYKFKFFYQKT